MTGHDLDLDAIRELASNQAAAYERMVELGGGVGKLGIRHRAMFEDMMAWQAATDNEHADTVLTLAAEVESLRAKLAAAEQERDDWQRRFIAASELSVRDQAKREDAEAALAAVMDMRATLAAAEQDEPKHTKDDHCPLCYGVCGGDPVQDEQS